MWYSTKHDVKGNREELANWFNFFDDVYNDDVWDEFCKRYSIIWVD